jgi:hypothetical protein
MKKLVVGDWVEVRSAEEILASLDDRGTFESLPFMPEMLPFIGKRFRVAKRVTKTCDTIDKSGFRRMKDTVLLEGLRCNGSAHGGCQAGCMLFWKEQWLKPLSNGVVSDADKNKQSAPDMIIASFDQASKVLEERTRTATIARSGDGDKEPTYMCLITEMKRASLPLAWWDLSHFVADVRYGNRRWGEVVRILLLRLFNWFQAKRGGAAYPYMEGGNLKKTPNNDLKLQPGALVRIKGPGEIMETLDSSCKTRGLRFDVGMFRYCGGQYRVAVRGRRLIDQKTGKMIYMSDESPCIMLENVVCHGDFMQFCPRNEYLFWREAWLERVS